jgi:hypothetical protein
MSLPGALIQGQGQVSMGEGQASAYDYNAQVAEQNAVQAIALSAQQERQQRIIGRKAIGDIKAGFGASGLSMEGSATDVLAESMAAAEMDALTVRYGGQVKSTNFKNDAMMSRYNATAARAGGQVGAAATVLGGLGSTGIQIFSAFGGGGK